MGSIQADELLITLHSRQDIIDLLKSGPRSKPEIVASITISRSTVDRGIRSLEKVGVVTRGDNSRYDLTLFGRLVTSEFDRLLDRFGKFAAVRSLIEDLDDDSNPSFDIGLFQEATIRHADGRGLAMVIETLNDATNMRLVDPPLSLVLLGLSKASCPFSEREMTLIMRRDVLSEVETVNPNLLKMLSEQNIEVYAIEEHRPFSIALFDRPDGTWLCLLIGNSDDGMAIFETSRQRAVEWAEDLLEQTVARSMPIQSIMT